MVVFYKISLFDSLEIREFYKLVRDIDKVFFNFGNLNLGLIIVFFEVYLNVDYIDRGLLIKEWMKGNRVLYIIRTVFGVNVGGGNFIDRGEGFVYDLTLLARDVVIGVLVRLMDLDIYNFYSVYVKRIEEIIVENKSFFFVFRDKFIIMFGGLDYFRVIVVAFVKEVLIGIEVIFAYVIEYLNKVLIEIDYVNFDSEIVDIVCGRFFVSMS